MPNGQEDKGLSRRDLLRLGVAGAVGVTLGGLLKLKAFAQTASAAAPAASSAPKATAKAVIQLWMDGGPAQTDTFDPKPFAGEDYCGPYKSPIKTNVEGIQLCQTLPLMAKQADKFSIIRSMTHPNNGHETAAYIMQTGTLPNDELVYPSMGAVIALKKGYEGGYKGALPPYIVVPGGPGRLNLAGFLPSYCRPFATGGDPNSKDFRVGGLVPAPGTTPERLKDRRELLDGVDDWSKREQDDAAVRQMDEDQQKAYALITGDAKKSFDMSAEKDEVRDKYGRTRFGQSCLLARRLVENGVPFITVHWGGWDTHSQHFERMEKMLPELDKAFAALLEDLSQRGLLDSTIVMWAGEFGRTPKIAKEPPWMGGRHHFANCFSVVVAGGGFRGGKVVGSSDRTGERVATRPVYPWDLGASIYKLMGIDTRDRLPFPRGRVVYVQPPLNADTPSGGILSEIM